MEQLLFWLLSLWICASVLEMKPGPGVVNVPEGDNARLPCVHSSGHRVDGFDWRKNNGDDNKMTVFEYPQGRRVIDPAFTGRVEYDPEKLASGDASIIIKNTDLKDSGTYTCGLGLERTNRQEIHITLNVGAAPMPYINDVEPFEDRRTWKLLMCTAHGVPEPELKWLNSAGEEVHKPVPQSHSGRSQVKLLLNVTKTDTYTCVATQEKICHQINNTRLVKVEESSTGLSPWVVFPVGIVISSLFIASVVILCCKIRSLKEALTEIQSKQRPSDTSDSVTQPLSAQP